MKHELNIKIKDKLIFELNLVKLVTFTFYQLPSFVPSAVNKTLDCITMPFVQKIKRRKNKGFRK